MKATLIAVVLALVLASSAAARGFNNRTLSDAHIGSSKVELQAQINHSTQVIHFFRVSHRWMIAPRHESCWSHVAWSKTCNRARQMLGLHVWLDARAQTMMTRLYPPSVSDIIMRVFGPAVGPFAIRVFTCESHLYTGASNGQYWGIGQMGSRERAKYGGSSSDALEQVTAAHRYYLDAGWGPWQCA